MVTEDNDTFLFGARHVYKNLFDPNKHVEHYHMNDVEAEMVVDRRKLKEAWMAMASFVDKAMKSHSKCDDCALFDAQWGSVIGDTTQHGINTRTILRSAKVCHRALMGTERGELDDAGYRGIATGRSHRYWPITTRSALLRP